MLINYPHFKNLSSLSPISNPKPSEKTRRNPKDPGLPKKTSFSKNSSTPKDLRNGHSFPPISMKDAENNAAKDGTITLETESKKETGATKNNGSFSWESIRMEKDGPLYQNILRVGLRTLWRTTGIARWSQRKRICQESFYGFLEWIQTVLIQSKRLIWWRW